MTDTLDKLLADAIRENKLLKKQLARSEYSRVQTEIGKDHTDSLQAHITEQLVAQKALVEEANLKLSLSLLAEQESRERAQISEKNARQSLEELLVAQAQLIQAEKLASLGQLIANVAHEINTPIGALKASGLMIAETLDTLLDQFPKLFAILSSQQRSLFMELVNNARTHHVALTTRDERSARKQVQQTLEDAGVDDADKKARILMDLKVRTAPLNYLELLSHIESPFILTTAQGIASIIGNTSNINAAVARVSHIVATLKSFSRSESEGAMTIAHLKDGIEVALSTYSSRIKNGSELVWKYEDLPAMRCFPDELVQVWTHLILNALQAIGDKGCLTIELKRVGGNAVVSVADSGCGIAPVILGRIFEPFFTTRAVGEGSGLGLDFVKKVVDKHKGRIEVETVLGVGSRFTVLLPLEQ